jgi:hypothetical protein
MSREERRAYQRQMKSMERGPALPPAAQARAERNAARRAARRGAAGEPAGRFSRRFVVRSVLAAVVLGFIAFSLQWSEGMPRALYVGLAVAAVVLVVAFGLRFVMSRAQRPG